MWSGCVAGFRSVQVQRRSLWTPRPPGCVSCTSDQGTKRFLLANEGGRSPHNALGHRPHTARSGLLPHPAGGRFVACAPCVSAVSHFTYHRTERHGLSLHCAPNCPIVWWRRTFRFSFERCTFFFSTSHIFQNRLFHGFHSDMKLEEKPKRWRRLHFATDCSATSINDAALDGGASSSGLLELLSA